MLTLKEMLNQTLSESGFGEYSAFFGSTRPDAKQVLALAQREINDLAKYEWQELSRFMYIPVTDESEYALPADYRKFVYDTSFTDTRIAQFPTSKTDWAYYESRDINTGLRYRVRLINNKITLMNPEAGGTLQIEYVSNWPVITSVGGGGQDETRAKRFGSDSDLIVLNDDLFMMGVKWRFQKLKSMEWQTAFTEYNLMVGRAIGENGNSRTLNMASAEEFRPLNEPYADLYQ